MRKKVLIDTDISLGTPQSEIDDGAALSFLLTQDKVEIVGISTVHGNTSATLSATNAYRLLKAFGKEKIPIAIGAEYPLEDDLIWRKYLENWRSQYGHTKDSGFVLSTIKSVDFLYQKINQSSGKISILCLGPLTNIANLAIKYPEVISKVDGLFIMGGDEKSEFAEFNIRCDPEAARIVFSLPWKIYAHGLSITRQLFFSRSDFKSLPNDNEAIKSLKTQAGPWIDIIEENGWEKGGCSLHDAVPAIALLHPELFDYSLGKIHIDCTSGKNRGRTQIVKEKIVSKSHQFVQSIDVEVAKSVLWKSLIGN